MPANAAVDLRLRHDMPHTPAAAPELLRASWYGPCKRVIDVVGALTILIVTLPVLALVALLVKLTSRGPVLYSQVRVGRGGRVYTLYKVRSMVHNCEGATGPKWSTKGDSRITPVGRFLRASHLDELPQLWNVLAGHMSLIGPRPERPEFVEKLEAAVPLYGERLAVRPGITGLAQVVLPPDSDLRSVRKKVAYDIYYLRNFGFWMDVRVVFGTVRYILRSSLGRLWDLFDVPCGRPVEEGYEDLTGLSLAPPHEEQLDMLDTITDVEILAGKRDTVHEVAAANGKAH